VTEMLMMQGEDTDELVHTAIIR